jgi:hypothetical protein
MSFLSRIFGHAEQAPPVSYGPAQYGVAAQSANAVARRFARGNVAAQFGRILTKERMEEERAQLRRMLQGRS